MKKWRLLLLCFYTHFAIAQQVVVANLKENIVYCGVDNPLSALVAGYPCSSVVLTVNNGKITKTNCGGFIYQPAEPGMVKIKVWVKNGKQLKKVSEVPYRIKQLPVPVAFVGTYRGGNIDLKLLEAMGGIRAVFVNTDINASFQIISYNVIGVRNKEVIFTIENTQAQYNEATLNYLKDLKAGDQLLGSNIICIGPDGKEWKLAPLEFTITE